MPCLQPHDRNGSGEHSKCLGLGSNPSGATKLT